MRGWVGIIASIITFFMFMGNIFTGNATEETFGMFFGWLLLTVVLNLGLIMELIPKDRN